MKQILVYFTLLATACYISQAQNIELSRLNSTQGVIISDLDDMLGVGTVNYAGDINADGLNDALIWTDFNLYLIYGTNSSSEISLSTLTPAQGIVIGDSTNIAFTGTGDVNGDNIDDLLTLNSGDHSICVIFGNKNGLQDMNLTNCSSGTFGIEISGCPVNYTNYTGCGSGSTLSGAGDINGDGIQDILIGSFMVGPTGLPAAGMVYVIFGDKNGLSNINLTTLDNTQGFSIMGSAEQSYLGLHISKAGDVNGDGIDDIILGSYYKFDAYVIYGSTSGFSNIDLSNFDPSQGFTISIDNSTVQMVVSDAGDFNGDGIDDLLIGLYGGAGGAYVLYGGTNIPFNINLNQLSENQGLLIVAPDTNTFGEYVSGLGDFNQDGLDDVLISADQDENNAGAGYVIFGTKSAPANITVATLTSTQGLVIIGGANEEVGYTVSGLGDFNGDNITDIGLGTHSELAAAYVVYSPFSGSGPNPPTPPPKSGERMGSKALIASIVAFILYIL